MKVRTTFISILVGLAASCATQNNSCAEIPSDPNCRDFQDANMPDGGIDASVDAPMIDAHVP